MINRGKLLTMNKSIQSYEDNIAAYERKIAIHKRVVALCDDLKIKLPPRSQTVGVLGELLAYQNQLLLGKKPRFPINHWVTSDFDLKIDNLAYEVKAAIKNKNGKYSFVWTRNIKNKKPLFDRMLLVLLESAIAKPVFFELQASDISHIKGVNIKSINELKKYTNKN